MPTPAQGYLLTNGDKVPGTTTVIGRWKESGGLIQWAYAQGREHERLASLGREAPRHLYDVTEKAADIGTQVHALVEKHCLKQPFTVPDDVNVRSAFDAYLSWEGQTKLVIVETETPLISERWKYGGTPDAFGEIDGKLVLLDWKSSNAVYQDHLIQLAAYRQLWDENHPARPLTGGSHLLRFSKEHGDFAHHYFPNLDDAWRAFVLMRELYDIDKVLKKRAA